MRGKVSLFMSVIFFAGLSWKWIVPPLLLGVVAIQDQRVGFILLEFARAGLGLIGVVRAIKVRKTGKLRAGVRAIGEIGSHLHDSAASHDVPLGSSHHEALVRSFRCPLTTPFTHNFIVTAQDVINFPEWIEV